jgi:hypothetical protein
MEKIAKLIEQLVNDRTKQIEEDAERRLNDKLTHILEHLAETYDLNIKQLLADITTMRVESKVCLGLTAQKKRCCAKVWKDANNGYCKRHQSQKPVVSRTFTNIESRHTHPPNIFYMEGCPGCAPREQNVSIDI